MNNNIPFTHPVMSVPETRQCEHYVIDNEPIASIDLMERAGVACSREIQQIVRNTPQKPCYVFCGTGNNGGDGLVIARTLHRAFSDLDITVVLCQSAEPHYSAEMQQNLERWSLIVNDSVHCNTLTFDADTFPDLPEGSIVIDAIFGIGLSRPAQGVHAAAIRAINQSQAFVIAVDIPSGLYADQHTPHEQAIVMADLTISVQYAKTAFLLPSVYPFCGEIRIVDIQMIAPPCLEWTKERLTSDTVRPLYKPLNPYAHKGSFGHGLLIAGSASMPGAVLLSASAAMRGGLGKLTVHTAARAANFIPSTLPEAILSVDENEQVVSRIPWQSLQSNINAIALGPGLGTDRKTINVIKDVLDSVKAPIILDADALNMLAENKTWLAYLPKHSILTPHFKEFERLAGPVANDFERIEKAQAFAQRYDIILILKGHHTLITMPDGHQFFNTTGNAGMGTAGSGDTLTGLLLALLAQGYSPAETALLGVYLHGLAGDIYVETHAPQSLIASDLPRHFSLAFQRLTQENYYL